MKIALDAMGGDHAPREIVLGAVMAVKDSEVMEMAKGDLHVVLVGKKEEIEKILSDAGTYPQSAISVVDAREVVGMAESPAQACKQKRDSSIVRCTELVKSKEVDACVSAGTRGPRWPPHL